jgi:Stigma-specific protein, Stig1
MMPGFEAPAAKPSQIYRSASRAGIGFAPYNPSVPAVAYPAGVAPSLHLSSALTGGGGTGSGGGGVGATCPTLGPCDSTCHRWFYPCTGEPTYPSCCNPGFTCVTGDTCICPAPKTDCGTSCTNIQTDSTNCGACGNICPTNPSNPGTRATCVGGQCECGSVGLSKCSNFCVDTQTDPNNCGSCGKQCMPGVGCVGGLCQCPQGQTWKNVQTYCYEPGDILQPGPLRHVTAQLVAPPKPGPPATIDMCYCTRGPDGTVAANITPGTCSSDLIATWDIVDPTCCTYNFGDSVPCGSVCCPPELCCGGDTCCDPPKRCCDNQCLDLGTSQNCRGCGDVCAAGTTCTNGRCCPPNTFGCGYNCCPNDVNCCGGTVCCPKSMTCCQGGPGAYPTCVDLSNDPNSCGKCGNKCGPNQGCSNGVCITCANDCQACDVASGQCGLPCPPNAACNLMVASGSNKDYAVLSKYLTTQGYTAVTPASTEAAALLQSGAVVSYSYNATLSGPKGEATISFIADSNYASKGSYVSVFQNSILQYVLFVNSTGTIGKVPPPSTASSTSSALAKQGSSLCTSVCGLICRFVAGGAYKALAGLTCAALNLPAAELSLPFCIGGAAALPVSAGAACDSICIPTCQCGFGGSPCGAAGDCCMYAGGHACINGVCEDLCPPTGDCKNWDPDTAQCVSYCDSSGDPCFQCNPTTNQCMFGCPGADCCDGACLDTQTNPQNCGVCGTACTSGEGCCNGVCTALNTTSNCRVCGNACASGEGCCNGVCTALNTTSNCGRCGNACASGEDCCNGVCTALNTTSNCGRCGNACASGEGCCNETCTELTTANNCGACGVVCTYSGTMGTCSGGLCHCPSGEFACTKTSRGDDKLCCTQVCCAQTGVCCPFGYPVCFPGGFCCTDQTGSECVAGTAG